MNTISALSALCLCLLAGGASAAPWSVSLSGTIDTGYDYTGVFGTAHTDLAGMKFTQTITLDPTEYPTYNLNVPSPQNQYIANYSGNLVRGSVGTETVTVNGVTHVYAWDFSRYNYGVSSLSNYLTQGFRGYGFDEDSIDQRQAGFTSDGFWLESLNAVSSYINPFLPSLDFNQHLAYGPQQPLENWQERAIASFSIAAQPDHQFDSIAASFYSNNISVLVLNAPLETPATVPVPAAAWLLGSGLLGLIGVARRKAA